MPLYVYLDPETEERIERVLPVEARDSFPGRVTVPESIAISGSSKDAKSADAQVIRGLQAIEDSGDPELVHQLTTEAGFTKEEIRETWKEEMDTAV